MIGQRISKLSSSKEIFLDEKPFYDTALKMSGYNEEINFEEPKSTTKKKQRSRQIIWFNPPFSQSVQTNVAAQFLGLIDKHFGNSNLKKYFNRQTIKVSYSTTSNMQNVINSHNRKVISTPPSNIQPAKTCNCRQGIKNCPLSGKCLTPSIIYQAKVSSNNGNTEKYIGLASNTFKEIFTNHQMSFNHEKYASNTHLSKHIWNLKRKNEQFSIEWSIKTRSLPYHPARKKCDLCLMEKLYILTTENTLNGRNELVQKCRHRNKYLLSNV